jgi:hypothetical protein
MRITIFSAVYFLFIPLSYAENIIPAPSGENDPLKSLHDKAKQYARQFYELNALPFGLSLDVHTAKDENIKIIADFFKQDKEFKEFSGKHPFEVIDDYGEYGDTGMFAGFATLATAYEYIFLRDSGAKEEEVKIARDRVIKAMKSWHVFTDITGGKGGIARGIRRIKPENQADPAIPGKIPEVIPLADEKGNPLPAQKQAVWRADVSGKYPDWIWMDDTSKDQTDGFIFALGVLWDAVAEDDAIPADLKDTLQEDAVKIAKKLMEKVDCNGQMLDLVIVDADGRKTTFHDLNPRIFEIIVLPEDAEMQNGFNGLLALHVMRTLYHVSGNEEIGKYYYEDLIVKRKFPFHVKNTLDIIYTGASTNYSNVNMANVALYSILRYETDEQIFESVQDILEKQFYNPGKDRQPKGLKQSFFDFTYAAFRKGETDNTAVSDGIDTLEEFIDPPYFDYKVVNCDSDEIAKKKCTAIDGTTIIEILDEKGHGDSMVSDEVLPKKLRPPSNFEWRSDPHDPNGGGAKMINPGGDFLGAYWIGRIMKKTSDSKENRSPFLRPSFMPVTPEPEEFISGEQECETIEPDEEIFPDAVVGDLSENIGDAAEIQDICEKESVQEITDTSGDVVEKPKKSSGCSMGGTCPAEILLILFLSAILIRRERLLQTIFARRSHKNSQ